MTEPVVVITGAAGALGGAVVEAQVHAGARVIAVDRDGPRLAAIASARVSPVAIEAGWAAIVAKATEIGAPTGAVLCAGGWQGGAPLHEGEDDVFRRMQQANLDTVYDALRALVPGMVARKHGSVVVIGSRAVERPWESAGAAAYAASKSGVVALARAVAAETTAHGVRVNAVLPSTIDTPANRAAMPDVDPSRWVTTDSLAGVIAFLLSDAARDVSGASIPVYGRV